MELKVELEKVDSLVSETIDILDKVIPKLELLMSMSDGLYKIDIKLILDTINQIKEQAYEIPCLTDEFRDLNEKISELEDELSDQENENSSLYWKNADLSSEVDDLEERLDYANQMIEDLQEELKEARDE